MYGKGGGFVASIMFMKISGHLSSWFWITLGCMGAALEGRVRRCGWGDRREGAGQGRVRRV
jgi:hypothetical protein